MKSDVTQLSFQIENRNVNGILKKKYQLPQLKEFCGSINYLATEQLGNNFSVMDIRKPDYCGVDITNIGPDRVEKG